MDEETTSRLEETLRELKNDREATDFISEHSGTQWSSFSDYYLRYLGDNNREEADVIRDAGFGEYSYQIINGRKRPVNRDHVIALCIAAGMSVKETDRALRLAGHNPLSPKDERDVRIVVCINNGISKVSDVDMELDRFGLEMIEKG